MEKSSHPVATIVTTVSTYISNMVLLDLYMLIASLPTVAVYLFVPFNFLTSPLYFVGGVCFGLAMCASNSVPVQMEQVTAKPYNWRVYFRTYKQNFKRAFVPAMVFSLITCVLFTDVMLIVNGKMGLAFSLPVSITAAFFLTSMFICFRLIQRVEPGTKLDTKAVLWQSLFLAYRHIGTSLLVVLILVACMATFLIIPITILILLGVAAVLIDRRVQKIIGE